MQQDGVRFLEKEITEIKVAVIGDMMTDRYITGRVNRISPEAPVPVNWWNPSGKYPAALPIRQPIWRLFPARSMPAV